MFLIKKNLIIKPHKKEAIIGGTFSGFIAGVLGTGGAIRGLTMAAFNLEKNVFIATSAVIDFGVDISRTVVYYINGYITMDILIYIPFLVVIGIAGTYVGKLLLTKISKDNFVNSVKNFYMTDAISRASKTMAKCAQEFLVAGEGSGK